MKCYDKSLLEWNHRLLRHVYRMSSHKLLVKFIMVPAQLWNNTSSLPNHQPVRNTPVKYIIIHILICRWSAKIVKAVLYELAIHSQGF